MNFLKKTSISESSNDSSLKNRFIEMAETVSKYGQSVGYQIRPYRSKKLKYFSALEPYKQNEVCHNLEIYIDICQATLSNGQRLDDSASLTWYALKRFNLRFKSDLFDKMNDTDVIEIYDQDNIQIFRNFHFLGCVSYTLEDVFCRPWPELFHRPDPSKTSMIMDVVAQYYRQEIKETVSLEHVGAHRIEEFDSQFKFKLDAVVKYLSPIYDQTWAPYGFIAVESADIVDSIEPEQVIQGTKELNEVEL